MISNERAFRIMFEKDQATRERLIRTLDVEDLQFILILMLRTFQELAPDMFASGGRAQEFLDWRK